jgi:hypothetical protein
MRSLFAVLSLLVGMSLAVQAQQAAPSGTPQSSVPAAATTPVVKPLPFTKQFRKTVAFIRMLCTKDGRAIDARGTGFWVNYPDERLGKDKAFVYLVTNRHVAECWEERQPMDVQNIWLRLNMRDGSSQEKLLAPIGNATWIFPADDSVDLAVLPLAPDQSQVDYLSIPISAFLEDDGIEEGDKIMFTGYFSQFEGVRRAEPILREGIIAMLPDEDMPTTTGKPGKLYLGDVHIFNGNSGSPVFVDLGGLHGNALILGNSLRMLGVVSGMYYEDTDLTLHVTTAVKGIAHGNSGIATIVPVKCLKDLLEHPLVKGLRDAQVAQVEHERKPAAADK